MPATRRKTGKPKDARKPSGLPFRLTSPDRVIFPGQQITKGDLAAYYLQVAEWMLPHVAGRPLAVLRCPEGRARTCFFQKHPPTGLPEVVERIEIQEKDEVDTYVFVNDAAGLVALVQFGAIEFHVWGARAEDVERPDRIVFDLDPDTALAWRAVVVESAFLVREVLSELGLTSFVKTTGGKGLHVVVPIERRIAWPDCKFFCKSVASFIEKTAPQRFTTNMSKAARRGKIFVDYLRNERGATAVAPYSCRAREGAPVAAPVDWAELRDLENPGVFTVATIPKRLAGLRRDPWEKLTGIRQSITAKTRDRLAGWLR